MNIKLYLSSKILLHFIFFTKFSYILYQSYIIFLYNICTSFFVHKYKNYSFLILVLFNEISYINKLNESNKSNKIVTNNNLFQK